MTNVSIGLCIALTLSTSLCARAEQTFPARLAGHAVLPASSFIAPPADTPADARISGKFTGPVRNMSPETEMGNTGAMHGRRPTGVSLPFRGQPLQGFSGYAMSRTDDGSILMLTDNGFGSKANSPDALLMFHRMVPDFDEGRMGIEETAFLRDPDLKVPFRISYEGSDGRYLTGADFDPESIQLVNGEVWIGDEFGPYLIRATLNGRVIEVHPTRLGETVIKGPDRPGISATSVAGKDWVVQRSGGFEGMAHQPGTSLLWAMLEKPLIGPNGKPEGDFLRCLAFDTETGTWTGQGFKLRLAEGATAIGDLNFIDRTRALVIERDNGEGDPSLGCEGEPAPDCFPLPAILKRVVLIDTGSIDSDGYVRRIGHIDLMAITDPEGRSRLHTDAGRDLKGLMTFPFVTIEGVMVWDDTHILVGNDNNLPFSSGRRLDAAADNEAILLAVPELLGAR